MAAMLYIYVCFYSVGWVRDLEKVTIDPRWSLIPSDTGTTALGLRE
jgi:hypothetical protein